MSCNHKDNDKCTKHRRQFSQAVDWKLLLHVEPTASAEQWHHIVSIRVVFCPQLVKTTLDMTCDLQRRQKTLRHVNYPNESVSLSTVDEE